MLRSLILSAALKEYEKGVQKIDAEDHRAALEHFSKAIDTFPDHPVFLNSRALCFHKLGNIKESLQDARAAVKLDETFIVGHLTVAKCCLDLGDLTALHLAYTHVLEIDPTNESAAKYKRIWTSLQDYECKYKIAYDVRDYKDGSYYMERALTYSPNCIRYKNNKAECFAYMGKIQESLNITNAILAKNSNEVDAIYNKALCYYYQQRFTAGLEILNLLFKFTNDHQSGVDLRNRFRKILKAKSDGNRAYQEKKYYEALYINEEALKIDPKFTSYNILLHCNCAAVLMQQNRFHAALKACNTALQLDRNHVKALIRRARCYEAIGSWTKALQDYRYVYGLERTDNVMHMIKEAKNKFKKTPYYYYNLLEIRRVASDIDIKSAYRKQSVLYHPDKHSSKSKQEIMEIEDYFKEINTAYMVLSNPTKKIRYDFEQLHL